MSNAPEQQSNTLFDDMDFAGEGPKTTPEPAEAPQSASQGVPVTEYVPNDENVTAAPEKDDIERLLEDPSVPLTLTSGTGFTIRQLRLREMLRLLRIISRGSANMLADMDLNFDNPDEFVQTFIAMVIFSIPEAETETIDFLHSMVDIDNPTGNSKQDAAARERLLTELLNPELEDTIAIITAIVAHEGRDLAALGKRLRSLLAVANKVGQVPEAMKPAVGG